MSLSAGSAGSLSVWLGLFPGWLLLRIDGHSMEPVLQAGDFVLIARQNQTIADNSIVLVDHPRYGHIIKYLARDGKKYRLSGLSRSSVTGEDMGLVDFSSIIGCALWSIGRRGIARLKAIDGR